VLQEAGHQAEAAEGEKSQFDVIADDTIVFSKQREGRWPDPAEIVAGLA
jgi:predicted Rdx family selenoprotein